MMRNWDFVSFRSFHGTSGFFFVHVGNDASIQMYWINKETNISVHCICSIFCALCIKRKNLRRESMEIRSQNILEEKLPSKDARKYASNHNRSDKQTGQINAVHRSTNVQHPYHLFNGTDWFLRVKKPKFHTNTQIWRCGVCVCVWILSAANKVFIHKIDKHHEIIIMPICPSSVIWIKLCVRFVVQSASEHHPFRNGREYLSYTQHLLSASAHAHRPTIDSFLKT